MITWDRWVTGAGNGAEQLALAALDALVTERLNPGAEQSLPQRTHARSERDSFQLMSSTKETAAHLSQ